MANQLPPNNAPQQKSGGSGVIKILLIVFAIFILGCGCCSAGAYFMFTRSVNALKQTVIKDFQNHPQVEEKLGGIDEDDVSFDFMASQSYTEENNKGGSFLFLFNVKGKNNKEAQIVIDPIEESTLLIIDGEKIPLEETNLKINNRKNQKVEESEE